jgi:hypothetical protein
VENDNRFIIKYQDLVAEGCVLLYGVEEVWGRARPMVLVRNAGCSPACVSTKRNAVFQIEYWLALLVIASFRGWPATNTCPSY